MSASAAVRTRSLLPLFFATIVACAGPTRTTEEAPTAADDDDDDEQMSFDAARPREAAVDASLPSEAEPPREPKWQECEPGTYTGRFMCTVSNLLPWSGVMSFTLVERTTGAGEFTMLETIPGTRIGGQDENFQGMFSAELQATFDCQSGALQGELSMGKYESPLVPAPVRLAGTLSGRYRRDGGSGFDGTMGPLTSPDYAIFGALMPTAMCTWQAMRSGAPETDAGNDASR